MSCYRQGRYSYSGPSRTYYCWNCKRFPFKSLTFSSILFQMGLVADPVFQAVVRLEFEDGLRTGVLPGGCWCPWGDRTYPRINTKPPWGAGWFWVGCGCHKVPIYRPNSNSAEFRAWVVLNYSSYVVLG